MTTAFGAFGAGIGFCLGPVGAAIGGGIGSILGAAAALTDNNCNCTPTLGPLGIPMGGVAYDVEFVGPEVDFNSLVTQQFAHVSFRSVGVNGVVNPDILIRHYLDFPAPKSDDFIARHPCEKCSRRPGRDDRFGYRCMKCDHVYCKACCLE
jgi:hypothetical protein